MLTSTALLALMLQLSPPEATTSLSLPSEGHETLEARTARYESIADDVLVVANSDPPLFRGTNAIDRTALLLLVTTYFESSGWHWAVDTGAKLGDHGRSWCIAQIHLPGARRTPEGWAGPDLIEDRRKCLRASMRVLRASLALCTRRPQADRLAPYLSGSCFVAVDDSRRRWVVFQHALRQVESWMLSG